MRIAGATIVFAGLVGLLGCGEQHSPRSYLEDPPAEALARKPAAEQAGEAAFREAAPQAPGGGQPPPAAEEPVARKIIYTASLDLAVADLEAARQRLVALIQDHGGYVAKSDVSGTAGTPRLGTWTVRVPVAKYQAFLDAVAAIGEVHRNSSNAQDVTDEYFDLEARLRNKKVEEERLIEHLKKSTGKLEDILAVERELSRVRGEIERAQGRLNYLAKLTAMTTVTVNLHERKDYFPTTAPTFGTTVGRTFSGSAEALVKFGKSALLVAVALVPWLPVVVVVGLVLRRVFRGAWRPTEPRPAPGGAVPA